MLKFALSLVSGSGAPYAGLVNSAELIVSVDTQCGQGDHLPKGARHMSERFAAMANKAAMLAGNYLTFLLAFAIVLFWAISGPVFGFSETWQLVINTGTTIVTFLMVFLIQNTQNRDSMALHLKIDELIRVLEKADNTLIEAEDETDAELQKLKEKYRKVAHEEGVEAVS
jgi:low affinity Fe/Cu permease